MLTLKSKDTICGTIILVVLLFFNLASKLKGKEDDEERIKVAA